MIQTLYSEKENAGIVFFDQNPAKRIIRYRNDPFDNSETTGTYFISVPNVLFSVNYSITPNNKFVACYPKIFFLKSEMSDGTNQLCMASFSNVYENGRICMPMSVDFEHSSLEELCKSVINNFWGSDFNNGVKDTKNYYVRSDIGVFTSWQHMTKFDLNWVPDHFVDYVSINIEKLDICSFVFYKIYTPTRLQRNTVVRLNIPPDTVYRRIK